MAKIYVSSTFEDLRACREQVFQGLQRMRHEVVAMESYVAKDDRPVDRCLEDVRQCDLYIGIFAHRYGHIPKDEGDRNPERRSITELEYRAAREAGKKCLIFLIDPMAPWPPPYIDGGEGAERLVALRAELRDSHSADSFQQASDLTTKVVTAVTMWEREQAEPARVAAAPAPPAPPGPPQFREILFDAYLAYSPIDEEFAMEMGARLRARGISVLLSRTALFARGEADFFDLDRAVCQCRAAAVVLSDAALEQMAPRADGVESVLRILGDRTGQVLALCRSANSLERAPHWTAHEGLDVFSHGGTADGLLAAKVEQALFPDCAPSRSKTIGLPFVILAMTAAEALKLDANPEVITAELGGRSFDQFLKLREALGAGGAPSLVGRYGDTRDNWRPFQNNGYTIRTMVEEVVQNLNQRRLPQLGGRRIKPQFYRFDALLRGNPDFWLLRQVYEEIGRTGCIILADEVSLFHPDLRRAFVGSSLVNEEQVALVTISPFDPTPSQVLEGEFREHLTWAFNRFEVDCDPQREFGVADARRLKRWLHSSLPQTVRGLRDRRPDQQAIAMFRNEVNPAHDSVMADFMYSKGGVI